MFNIDESKLEETPLKLSIRKPSELRTMEIDPASYVFPNRMLTIGEPLTIIGPSGSRKSWLVLQMAACVITGRDFLGWPVEKQDGKWLIIQTENDSNRLIEEMHWLHKWLGEDDSKLVDEKLVIHTLEGEHDRILNISNPSNTTLLATLIREVKPMFVVFDPLYNFRAGNLNSDDGMQATCQGLAAIARMGNLKATPIILHHTLTGREGIRKAVGFDKASYSRNSRALHGFTRRQIHIAPECPDNSEKLVIACGKNSNFPEFKTFGVMLNRASMIYEVNPAFNEASWLASLSGEIGSAPATVSDKPTPENIAKLVAGLPLPKKTLVELIMDEYGRKKSQAYILIDKAQAAKTIKRDARGMYGIT